MPKMIVGNMLESKGSQKLADEPLEQTEEILEETLKKDLSQSDGVMSEAAGGVEEESKGEDSQGDQPEAAQSDEHRPENLESSTKSPKDSVPNPSPFSNTKLSVGQQCLLSRFHSFMVKKLFGPTTQSEQARGEGEPPEWMRRPRKTTSVGSRS